MKNTSAFQQSIAATRKRIHEMNRLSGVAARRARQEEAEARAKLELFLDELVQETGLDLSKQENYPTMVVFLSDWLRHNEKMRELFEDIAARHCDSEGFPTERGDW